MCIVYRYLENVPEEYWYIHYRYTVHVEQQKIRQTACLGRGQLNYIIIKEKFKKEKSLT